MFVQIIRGRVADPGALKAGTERWVRDLPAGVTVFCDLTEPWLSSAG